MLSTLGRSSTLTMLFLMLARTLSVLLGPTMAVAQENSALQVPSVDPGVQQIEQRAAAQQERAANIAPFHGFSFANRQVQSGITFRHQPTRDGTVDYKMVHYDHGNALAVADVNGDGALDIYFANQIGSNELWLNKGDGTFENITRRSPVIGLGDLVSVGASFADIDNDGDPDLYVTTVNMGNRLFRNKGRGRFEDITTRSGTGHVAHSSGAVFFDIDNDGLLDLFVTNVGRYTEPKLGEGNYFIGLTDAFSGHRFDDRTERSTLYRNLGKGRFEDVTDKFGLVENGWVGDASFADLDRDGFLDLYIVNMQGDDRFWHNNVGKGFVNQTAEVFPKTPWGAMGIKFFDWDNDRDLDLFLTDMHSDMSNSVSPANEQQKSFMTWDDEHLQGGDNNIFGNAFFRNDEGKMTEISDEIGAENYWPWGVSVGDLNADGFEDAILTSSMNYPFRYLENAVLLNDAGNKFERVEYLLGVEPRSAGPTKDWFRINCPPGPDASPPALPSVGTMLKQCGFRKGRTTVIGTRGTRTAAIFDIDGDGDQDIVTGEFHDVPQVLVSNLSEKKEIYYLSLKLRGTTSNRDGLGATVTVRAGDDIYYRQYDGKLGYLGQSSFPLYLGLGDHQTVESVTVQWPSGKVQKYTEQFTLNKTMELKER